MATKASSKGRIIVKLVHKPTGEFYMTMINERTRREAEKGKLTLMKYSRKLRKKVLFTQAKAG